MYWSTMSAREDSWRSCFVKNCVWDYQNMVAAAECCCSNIERFIYIRGICLSSRAGWIKMNNSIFILNISISIWQLLFDILTLETVKTKHDLKKKQLKYQTRIVLDSSYPSYWTQYFSHQNKNSVAPWKLSGINSATVRHNKVSNSCSYCIGQCK